MKVAINARLDPGSGLGGVESVIISLVGALGRLTDGDEQYVVVTNARHPHWLDEYIGRNQSVVAEPSARYQDGVKKRGGIKAVSREAGRFLRKLNPEQKTFPAPRVSNGFIESLGCDVVHFPYQHFEICARPSVYNPHDLQHRHFPHFFTPESLVKKDVEYRAGCEFSTTIVTASHWVKDDICLQYNVNPAKIAVIPWASPTQIYAARPGEEDEAARRKFNLPAQFAFFPAMTWPHKNHLRLLEALAWLKRERGLEVPFVSTGKQNDFFPEIQRRVEELGLQKQVQFLGIVSAQELQSLYRLCTMLVVPSLFEAASGPVFEAWDLGAAVACSNVTSLPQQIGDAGLIFDPYDVPAMAATIEELYTKPDLRRDLVARGKKRLGDFNWDRTARAYRAVYRRAARQKLTAEDEKLLAWDWSQAAV